MVKVAERTRNRDRDAAIQKKGHSSHQSESNISVSSTTRNDSGDDMELLEYKSGLARTQY